MDKILKKPAILICILALLCAYLFLYQSGRMALTDPDETFYAETAKEMLVKNDWVTPYLYGKPQFEKPILIYWLVEFSYKIFGVNEFAARFPSAIFAFIGIIAMFFLGNILFNKRVGVLSAVMLGACVEYVILSRACVTDMILSTFMLLGCLFFFYGYLKGRGYCYILSAAFLAFAVLTKGPVAIALPIAAFAAFLLLSGNFGAIKKIPIFSCIIVFIVIAAPWYLVAYRLHGREFIDAFFGFHNIIRFTQSEHEIGSQFYYNIPIVFGGFFPWSVFLPYGFWRMFKKIRTTNDERRTTGKGALFVLIWFFVIFIFFSISSTKLPTYIFPCFISLALISAVFWDDFLNRSASKNTGKAMDISFFALFAVIILGAIGVAIYVKLDYPAILSGIIISTLLLIFGFTLSLAAYLNKRYIAALFLIVYSMVIFLYPLNHLVLPVIEHYETSKAVAGELGILMKPEEKLGSESNYLPGLAFYTGKFPVDLDKHHNLMNFINSKDRVWAVIKEKNHRQLYDPAINAVSPKPSYMVYRIGKRAIVTNEIPDDYKYIIKRKSPD